MPIGWVIGTPDELGRSSLNTKVPALTATS